MSKPSKHQSEEALFEKALQLESHSERLGFLKGACGDDAALFSRLVDLIEAHQGDENFIQTVDGLDPMGTDDSPLTEGPGTVIGRYKLLESLGEGGFGLVWAAEQKEPVKRRVALKIIKLGMDTRKVVARFEAERQALALMDHPNIARVFDAGATDNGRPYFVMELVKGIPITQYCEQENLTVNDRLTLFTKVCRAIQHAHQKGIIHRDIKPSNVLVTLHDGEAVPKVIDFGIAKATQQELTEKTIYTQFNQFIGTPAYMSPEQAELSGLDIDTRSDIYSLGVLLYEMLTRSTPFDSAELMKAGLDEMRKTIREREPVRPSTRLSEITQATGASGRTKSPHLPPDKNIEPDIDWIVMKCLEKDRSRRYDTANGLALDVKRHLENEPIIARPPSVSYRVQKAWRRNRKAIAACLAVTAALVIGFTIAVWQAIEANHAKQRELERSREAQNARQIAETNAELAVRERDRALAAENEATRLQAEAETKAKAEYRRAYAADMNRAYREIRLNKLGSALKLLNRYKPQQEEEDIRGWEWRYLRQFCQSDALYRIEKKPSQVQLISVSADGKYFSGASAANGTFVGGISSHQALPPWAQSLSGTVLFAENHPIAVSTEFRDGKTQFLKINTETGTTIETHTLDGRFNPVRLSDNAQLLAIHDTQKESFVIIRMESRQVVHSVSLKQFGRRILPHALSTDMNMLAIGDLDNLSRFGLVTMDTAEVRWLSKTPSDSDYVSFEFSPDSNTIATCAGFIGSEVQLWSTTTGDLQHELPGYKRWVRDFEFLDGGKTLATAGADGSIRIWDLENLTLQQTLIGHQEEVLSIKSIGDGTKLLSSGFDGEILVWDRNHTIRREPYRIINHNPPTYYILQAQWWGFSSKGQAAITLNERKQLIRWSPPNFDAPDILAEFNPDVIDFILSEGGKIAITFDSEDHIIRWDLQGPIPRSQLIKQQPDTVLIAVSALSNRLVVGHFIKESKMIELQVIDLKSNEITGTYDLGKTPNTPHEIRVILSSSALSRNGEWLAFPIHAKRKVMMNLSRSPLEVTDLENPAIRLNTLAISPDNQWIAACGEPHLITVHEMPSGKRRFALSGQMSGAKSVTFSNDSDRIVTLSGGEESLRLWDVKNQQDLLTLPGQGSFWNPTQFSPNGNHIGSLNTDGKLHIWSAPSWEEIDAMESTQHH